MGSVDILKPLCTGMNRFKCRCLKETVISQAARYSYRYFADFYFFTFADTSRGISTEKKCYEDEISFLIFS